MKIRLWLLFGCLCLWVAPLAALAGPEMDYIEQLPTGCIDWTQGIASAKGTGLVQDDDTHPDQDRDPRIALTEASHNLFRTLKRLRMDDRTSVSDLIAGNKNLQARIEEMASAAKLVNTTTISDGNIQVTIELNLLGGFAQLMLPPEIRQVDAIRPLNGSRAGALDTNHHEFRGDQPDIENQDIYSGLLVDARNLGATPAMVPVVRDENGQEVYGPAYVSREYAVQNGVCRYIRTCDSCSDLPRIAPNPLRVKGLRTAARGSCDIVISNADASKIRGASSHLEFLKQCRVVIMLD